MKSALDQVITNYKRVNPFGSSHQQLVDDASAELARLRAVAEAAREILRKHHGQPLLASLEAALAALEG